MMKYDITINYKILTMNILFLVTLFLAPIGYLTIRSSLFLEIILLFIIFNVIIYHKIRFSRTIYLLVLLFLSIILWLIPRLIEGNHILGTIEIIKMFRSIAMPFFYSLFLFIFIKNFTVEQKLKIFYIIIIVISIDAYFSSIMYNLFFFRQPEALYPWSLINLEQDGRILNPNDIPTLFAYPYLHSEVFLFGVVSIYTLALKWNKLIFLNLFIVHALFQVSTAILGLIVVFLIYFSFIKIRYVFIFFGLIALSILLLWDFIEPVLIFYDYFESDIFINILGLDRLVLYFQNVSLYNQLFGTFLPSVISQESGYGTEIGYFRVQMKFGLIFFLLVGFIFYYVSYISFKRYRLSHDKKYLIYSLVPIYIFIDGLHYFNFFKVQTTYICLLIFFLILDDTLIKRNSINEKNISYN